MHRSKTPRRKAPRPKITRDLIIRPAVLRDLVGLTRLAEAAGEPGLNARVFKHDVLGRKPAMKALVAVLDGVVVAAAFYIPTFDVPTAKRGLFLPGLLFNATARARGVGPVLLAACAALAHRQKMSFVHWGSAAWNVDEHDYYRT
ncbi:MAG: hypothetical protein JNK21_16640, partial [Rhodospirillaceae bacterium]|nr:hypothetical protein [Rhodospirillaceae bacterium]